MRRRKDRKELRQKAAKARQDARKVLGDIDQLARLEVLFPDGAKREKARLRGRLNQ